MVYLCRSIWCKIQLVLLTVVSIPILVPVAAVAAYEAASQLLTKLKDHYETRRRDEGV